MKLSVIIGTKDRPESLERLLNCLSLQTRKPDEVIIVDDGNFDRRLLDRFSRNSSVGVKYFKKENKGLTISRNLGVKNSQGDILMFLDDDVLLGNNYIRAVEEVFLQDKDKKVGGAGGVIDVRPAPLLQNAFLKLFLLDSNKEGMVLPSGIGTLARRLDSVKEVQWLSGCNMSYRREVFEEFKFDEAFSGNGWGDDRDFSYRVSKKYKLIATPYAGVKHFEDKAGRIKPVDFGFMELHHLHLFFQKNMPKNAVNIISFYWAMAGICLKNLLKLKLCRLRGNLSALFYLLFK